MDPASRERYVALTPAADAIEERVEALEITWFASADDLSDASFDGQLASARWSGDAPTHLGVVGRDDRSGVSVAEATAP